MAHPLESYRTIAKPDFIVHVEEKFYTTYHDELINGLHVEIDRTHSRMYLTGVDLDGNNFEGYTTLSSYVLKEYDKLEKGSLSHIEIEIMSRLDENKQKVFIKNIVAELHVLQTSIEKNYFEARYDTYKSILSDKVSQFIQALTQVYLSDRSSSSPKIQWLGKTNVLVTLIYDLWQGQDKIKEPSTRPIIKALKKDLEALLINNFLDEKGKPLTESTISDYLNSSKPEKRAKKGLRIELSY